MSLNKFLTLYLSSRYSASSMATIVLLMLLDSPSVLAAYFPSTLKSKKCSTASPPEANSILFTPLHDPPPFVAWADGKFPSAETGQLSPEELRDLELDPSSLHADQLNFSDLHSFISMAPHPKHALSTPSLVVPSSDGSMMASYEPVQRKLKLGVLDEADEIPLQEYSLTDSQERNLDVLRDSRQPGLITYLQGSTLFILQQSERKLSVIDFMHSREGDLPLYSFDLDTLLFDSMDKTGASSALILDFKAMSLFVHDSSSSNPSFLMAFLVSRGGLHKPAEQELVVKQVSINSKARLLLRLPGVHRFKLIPIQGKLLVSSYAQTDKVSIWNISHSVSGRTVALTKTTPQSLYSPPSPLSTPNDLDMSGDGRLFALLSHEDLTLADDQKIKLKIPLHEIGPSKQDSFHQVTHDQISVLNQKGLDGGIDTPLSASNILSFLISKDSGVLDIIKTRPTLVAKNPLIVKRTRFYLTNNKDVKTTTPAYGTFSSPLPKQIRWFMFDRRLRNIRMLTGDNVVWTGELSKRLRRLLFRFRL